jgi:plastocyanin
MESNRFYGVLLFMSVMLCSCCVQNGARENTTTSSSSLVVETEPVTTSSTTQSTTRTTNRPTTTSSTTTSSTSSTVPIELGQVTVVIANKSFVPQNITVALGTVVTWVNNDPSEHQVISDLDFAGSKGGFTRQLNDLNSKRLYKGAIYKYRFQRAGMFGYHCNLYPAIRGSVTVIG